MNISIILILKLPIKEEIIKITAFYLCNTSYLIFKYDAHYYFYARCLKRHNLNIIIYEKNAFDISNECFKYNLFATNIKQVPYTVNYNTIIVPIVKKVV